MSYSEEESFTFNGYYKTIKLNNEIDKNNIFTYVNKDILYNEIIDVYNHCNIQIDESYKKNKKSPFYSWKKFYKDVFSIGISEYKGQVEIYSKHNENNGGFGSYKEDAVYLEGELLDIPKDLLLKEIDEAFKRSR